MSMHMSHVALRVPDPEVTGSFVAGILGLRETSRGDSEIRYSANAKHHELQLIAGDSAGLDHLAVEVDTAEEFEQLRKRVADSGAPILEGVEVESGVENSFRLQAPADLVVEVVLGMEREPALLAHELAGHARKFGHVTLSIPNRLELVEFLTSVMGFHVSDDVMEITWIRCDEDHHGIGMDNHSSTNRMHHHAWEIAGWDGLLRYLDDLALQDLAPLWGPGRHGPGHNLYTYVLDPDGALVEAYADLERIEGPNRAPRPKFTERSNPLNLWGGTPPNGFLECGMPILPAEQPVGVD